MTHTRAVHRAARAVRTPALVHAVPYDYPGKGYAVALCGAPVHDRRKQPGRIVTCQACLTEERRLASLDLGQPKEEPIMPDPAQPSAHPSDDEDPIPLDATFDAHLPNTEQTLDEMFGADAGGPLSFAELPVLMSEQVRELTILPGIPGHQHAVDAEGHLSCGCQWPAGGPFTSVADLAQRAAARAGLTAPVVVTLPSTTLESERQVFEFRAGQEGLTPVLFPVLAKGVTTISVEALEAPGRRVAEILEALEPVLTPPSAVAGITALVERANQHTTTDAATFAAANELYELICQNEKGLEASLDHVVGFFYRPWKMMTGLRARLAKPLAEAKARLSRDAGEWKRLDDQRVERERRAAEAAAAAEERARLELAARQEQERAAAAEQAGRVDEANQADQNAEELKTAAAEVVPPTLPVANFSPAAHRPAGPSGGGTRSKDSWECVVTDELAIYKAIAAGTVSKAAAPLDLAYLKRRANDDKDDLKNLIPGCEARKVGGLASKGKR